jgi:nitroreductase
MEMLECIETLRSISVYRDDPVPDDILTRILDMARWAPSGANSQPVELVVVKDRRSREKIRDMAKEILAMGNVGGLDELYGFMEETGTLEASGAQKVTWDEYYNAPAMVIVTANEDLRGTEYEDFHHFTMETQAPQATIQTMRLAAHALGVGSLWLKYFDPERLKPLFGIPRTQCVAGIVLLGYPKYVPRAPELALSTDPKLYPRRPAEDMIHYDGFDLQRWTQYQLYDPWRLPRREFLRTEKYVRPTRLPVGPAVGPPIGGVMGKAVE